jgi:hypothetical protein
MISLGDKRLTELDGLNRSDQARDQGKSEESSEQIQHFGGHFFFGASI